MFKVAFVVTEVKLASVSGRHTYLFIFHFPLFELQRTFHTHHVAIIDEPYVTLRQFVAHIVLCVQNLII